MSDDIKITQPTEKSLFHNKSAAGKGDFPRSVSKAYWDNWDYIDWKKDGQLEKIDENATEEL